MTTANTVRSSAPRSLAVILLSNLVLAIPPLTVMPDDGKRVILLLLTALSAAVLFIARKVQRFVLPLMFAVTFALFHSSLLAIELLDKQEIAIDPYLLRWYFSDYTLQAHIISTLFLVVFSAASLLTPESRLHTGAKYIVGELEKSNVLLWFFTALVVIFLTVVFLVLGIENYAEYNELARGADGGSLKNLLILLYPALAITAFFCVMRVRSISLFLVVFGCWALPTFAVGLRGEVLLPVAMMAPSLTQRLNVKFRAIPTLLGSLALLWLIAYVRVYRAGNNHQEAFATASPARGLLELGGSLRPVFEVVRWTESGLRDFYYGLTYWAPLERLLQKVLPLGERLPASSDDRLMNVAIVQMTGGGNYGFSIAAEAYVNFGWFGVVIVAVIAGLIITNAGGQSAANRFTVFNVAVVYALFYHIRQSYVGAWGSFFIVVALSLVLIRLDRTMSDRLHKNRLGCTNSRNGVR